MKGNNTSQRNFNRGKKLVAFGGIVVFLIALFVFIKWMHYRYTHAVTNNAFVETDMVEIAPLVAGHLKKLLVDEGDRVKQGQVVAFIDDRDYEAVVVLRRAHKEQTLRQVEKARITAERLKKESANIIVIAERGVIETRELLRKTQANLERVTKDYERYKKLVTNSVVPQRLFDKIAAEYEAAHADHMVAETALRVREEEVVKAQLTKLQVEEAKRDVSTLMAAYETADKNLALSLLNLEHTMLRSPIEGMTAKRHFDEGDYISPGFPVLSVYDEDNIYVEANLEETKTRGVKVGQRVDLWVDAYGGDKLRGKVVKVGMACGRQFTLIPRDVSAGEFTKVVQRIPIKIKVSPSDTHILKPGMSAKVEVLIEQLKDALIVPIQVVANREGKKVCYIATPQGPKQRQVKTGSFNDTYVHIISGLEAGEQVLLIPPQLIESK